jgi:hypothetical protein
MVDVSTHFDTSRAQIGLGGADGGAIVTSNTLNPISIDIKPHFDTTRAQIGIGGADGGAIVTSNTLEGDPNKPLVLVLEGDPSKPLALAITELPQINLSADIGIKPTRIHNPAHFTFCISFLGFELLSFDLCGEAMTIIEPYLPHKMEICN